MQYIGTISAENWTEDGIKHIFNRLDGHELYVGREIGKSGYRHYQFCMDCAGDLESYNDNNALGWHVERCISWEESKNYCRKTDNYLYIGNSREERYYQWIKQKPTLPIWIAFGSKLASQNDRQIDIWIDTEGNHSKSTFSYLLERRGRCLCVPRDQQSPRELMDFIAMHYNNEPIIIIDIPREASVTKKLCNALESLKDGSLNSSKYHGIKKYIKGVKILVFTNNYVDGEIYKTLTKDRWRKFTVQQWLKHHSFGESSR